MILFTDVSLAFYKTLFFNELARKDDILVVYKDNPHRPFRGKDFLDGEMNYNHIILKGSRVESYRQLIKVLLSVKYDKLVVGGYDNFIAWISVCISPRKKNGIIVESTFRETRKKGFRVLAKRLFFKRVRTAYVCGKSHADLVKAFGFRGKIVNIGTVGLIHRVPQPHYKERSQVKDFLFVGRLTKVKNLEWLIDRFAQHPNLTLTIIGAGELESKLKAISPPNVLILGPMNNMDLPKYYQAADVFVLASISEPYGLVVEEALNNGTPVLLSDMIGCQDNLVVANNVGLVFQHNDVADFENKLAHICNVEFYNHLRLNVSKMDFERHANNMVNSFAEN